HPQLSALLTQPGQLSPLVLAQLSAAGLPPPPVSTDPVLQRARADPQVPGDLRDRLTGLPDQPDRALLEVLIELPARLCHRPSSLKAMCPRYEGKPTPPGNDSSPAPRATSAAPSGIHGSGSCDSLP